MSKEQLERLLESFKEYVKDRDYATAGTDEQHHNRLIEFEAHALRGRVLEVLKNE